MEQDLVRHHGAAHILGQDEVAGMVHHDHGKPLAGGGGRVHLVSVHALCENMAATRSWRMLA